MHRNHRILINHNHNYFNPIAHNFSDYFMPGEEYVWLFGNNPDHFYCEGISREEMQAAWNSDIRGVGLVLLPMNTRSPMYVEKAKSRKADLYTEDWTMRTMTPMLLHDVMIAADWITIPPVSKWWLIKDKIELNKAKFHGYWTESIAKSTSPKVLASVYTWDDPMAKYHALIIVANLGRKAQPAALNIDFNKLGISKKQATFRELWKDRALTIADLATLVVPANHFRLIAIK